MTQNMSSVDILQLYTGNGKVIVANGNFVTITHIGSCEVAKNVKLLDVKFNVY